MTLHDLVDGVLTPYDDDSLQRMLDAGADPNWRQEPSNETALHVASRRYRPSAMQILINRGAYLDETTAGGKTAYAHAARRGFTELVEILAAAGADTALSDADRVAVAIVPGRLDVAREMLDAAPGLVKLLLAAGSGLTYPDRPGDDGYLRRLREDASPRVRNELPDILSL